MTFSALANAAFTAADHHHHHLAGMSGCPVCTHMDGCGEHTAGIFI